MQPVREFPPNKTKENQGKPNKSKENRLDFLGFLWPIRGFSKGYRESNLKISSTPQLTRKVVSSTRRIGP
jgi:hypothetical protein